MAAGVVLTDRAVRLHRSCLVFDGHNDLVWQLYKRAMAGEEPVDLSQRQPAFHTDIPRLEAGGVGAQFWAAFVPPVPPGGQSTSQCAMGQIEGVHDLVRRYPDTFAMAYSAADVERVRREGRIASLIGVEGGRAIENRLDLLGELYARGARYMTLTHADSTDWCDASTDAPRHGGLTPFGEQVVREMNRLGMMVDVTHVSDDAANDVLRVSRAPVIASHSSAAGVAAHPRNLNDALLEEIAASGGAVMVNFYSGFIEPAAARIMCRMFELDREFRVRYPVEADYRKAVAQWQREHPAPRGDVQTLIDHIDHVVRVAGINHVGLGADYDGVGTLPEQLDDVSGYPYITQALLDRGYDGVSIGKILGGNLLRVLGQVEAAGEGAAPA